MLRQSGFTIWILKAPSGCRIIFHGMHDLSLNLADLKIKADTQQSISLTEATEILKLIDEKQILSLMGITRAAAENQKGKKINFYYTSRFFPAISVTGSECALRCKHCETKLLQNLPSATTKQRLVEKCIRMAEQGARGVLLTGGCSRYGKVPIVRFLDAISEIKKKTSLVVIAHTGILNLEEAKKLVAAKLDGAAVDVVGMVETAKNVYGVEIAPQDYLATLKALENAKMPIISPHVCVGLNFGSLKHELVSLRLIQQIKPATVVITALMPLRGTPMEKVKVAVFDVIKVIVVAKLMFPHTTVTLGCARAKGSDRLLIEKLAIQAGIDSMAVPSEATVRVAESLGLEPQGYAACCGVPPLESLKLPSWREVYK